MLNINHLALRRGTQLLIEDANVIIRPGERCGLVGANGCGKSSLFSLILGDLEPDAGEVRLAGNPVIAHVAQESPADDRAAIEHVMDGDHELREVQHALRQAEERQQGEHIAILHGRLEAIEGYGAEARAARLMHGLGFRPGDEQVSIASLSGGWRVRLNLAQALMCRSELLLLDEPTNHLDLDAVIWLQNWLEAYSGTLLLISHDRDFLDRVTNRILHIEGHGLHSYSGNYAAFERQRSERLIQQQDAYERQQAEIRHIQRFIDRFRAQATKARQAQSRIKALERMETIAPVDPTQTFRFAFRKPDKLPNPLLRLEKADCGYPGETVLGRVDLDLAPGDRIGLLGRNGAGKSTLIRTLAGDLPHLGGERFTAQDLRIGYFAQHQLEQLDDEASPLLHLQRLDPAASVQPLRDYLGQFGFPGDMALAPAGPFSGGERARLVLAMLVYGKPNLLLLDEPTNHLDLDMRDALALALQDFPGALVVIAHDRHLLHSTVDRLLLVHDGVADEFRGDLDDYARWLISGESRSGPREAADGSATPGTSSRKVQRQQQARRRLALQPLRREVARLEQHLEALQKQLHRTETALADPELYQPAEGQRLQALLEEQGRIRRSLEDTEHACLDAMARLEEEERAASADTHAASDG